MSQYFELVLYLSEEERVASQWVHVLNSITDSSLKGQDVVKIKEEPLGGKITVKDALKAQIKKK